MNNVDKYYWIINHPKLCKGVIGQASIELSPQMVNPVTNEIDSNKALNTKQEWGVEVSEGNEYYDPDDKYSCRTAHDWGLDTGGDTAEEAIDNLYELVLSKHGEY